MLVKIVSLFLIGMAVLAMFGKLRMPGKKKLSAPRKCRKCGGFILGRGPCNCEKRQG